jgi:Recombination endonuclease VII
MCRPTGTMLYVDTKKCSACKMDKLVTEFYLVSRGMPDRRSYCKACTSAKRTNAYRRNRGNDASYEQVLKREYGITLAEYNTMLRNQAYRCSVCRRPESIKLKSGQPRRLAVDHDHVTGRLRGLLCHRCNILVWAMEENHTTLGAVQAYVDDFRESFASGAS